MKLVPVSERPDRYQLLWDLLLERDPVANISHRKMPTWDEHVAFVDSRPYAGWYFICDPEPYGSVYLTHRDEIGVAVFRSHQGMGYARRGIEAMMRIHGARRYLANVAPGNTKSHSLFEGMGFQAIQVTYERL